MRKTVTLSVPNLLQCLKSLVAVGAPLPTGGLALWLSKSTQIHTEPLFKGDGPISTAALLATAKGYPKGMCYCLASPIDCFADQQTVYIVSQAQLEISQAQAIVATLNQFLQQDDIQLVILEEGLWLFVMKHHTDVTFSDIAAVSGKSMGLHLPNGKDAVYWRRLLTECQMLLSQTTSIWFWGNGIDSIQLSSTFDTVFSNDAIMQAMALNAGVNAQTLPAQYTSLQRQTSNNLLLDKRLMINAQQDPTESLNEIAQLEQNWIKPLLADLQKGQLDSLNLVVDEQTTFSLKKSQLRYFWRKIKPLTAFIH